MFPILVTLLVIAPILALGTWLYLRRHMLSLRKRILLTTFLFLFVAIAGPVTVVVWRQLGATEEIIATGRARPQLLGTMVVLWSMAVFGVGIQLFRLCRWKGEP